MKLELGVNQVNNVKSSVDLSVPSRRVRKLNLNSRETFHVKSLIFHELKYVDFFFSEVFVFCILP